MDDGEDAVPGGQIEGRVDLREGEVLEQGAHVIEVDVIDGLQVAFTASTLPDGGSEQPCSGARIGLCARPMVDRV